MKTKKDPRNKHTPARCSWLIKFSFLHESKTESPVVQRSTGKLYTKPWLFVIPSTSMFCFRGSHSIILRPTKWKWRGVSSSLAFAQRQPTSLLLPYQKKNLEAHKWVWRNVDSIGWKSDSLIWRSSVLKKCWLSVLKIPWFTKKNGTHLGLNPRWNGHAQTSVAFHMQTEMPLITLFLGHWGTPKERYVRLYWQNNNNNNTILVYSNFLVICLIIDFTAFRSFFWLKTSLRILSFLFPGVGEGRLT